MKIALDWIAQYLAPVPAPQAAADALMNAGLPVESIAPFGNTSVLDVEVTSNRPDCLSHIGLARELAALVDGVFNELVATPAESAPPVTEFAEVTVDNSNVEATGGLLNSPGWGIRYYSGRVLRDIKVARSPEWLRHRLESVGLRSVNNVVDITNYVLMELGQPLHAFDLNKLSGNRIVLRKARNRESLLAIDGKTYELSPSMNVIADAEIPVAIPGVMGGKLSEVTEFTVNIFLESANFDPLGVRTTSRNLALKSDSSYRFERGLDPTLAERASRRAAQLILELCGGTLCSGVIAVGSDKRKPLNIDPLRVKRIPEILGIDIPAQRAVEILARLGFSPELKADRIFCTVPSHRLDIEREIDLLEEVARVHGYAHIPTLDRVIHAVQPEPAGEKAARQIKNTLVAAGFSETISLTFIPKAHAESFLPPNTQPIALAHGGWKGEVLRPSLFPSLLAIRQTNQNIGIADARIFEVSESFWQLGDAATNPPAQQRVLTLLGNSVAEVRGALETVLERLNVHAKLAVMPSAASCFAAGVSGDISVDLQGRGIKLGRIGQFTQELQKKFDLRQAVCGAEVLYDPLIALFEPVRRAAPLPRFPGVKRDLSIVVDESVRWSDVESALRSARLTNMESVDFVTTFRSKQLGAGKKSLTLALDFRDPARTLKSEEVDAQVKAAVELLAAQFGAVLRT